MVEGLDIAVGTLTLAGRTFSDVKIGGVRYGLPLDSGAPIYVLVGGITASPYPLGGPQKAWWLALSGPNRIDLSQSTVLCPAMPGNGSGWTGFEDGPRISGNDIAEMFALWLEAIGCQRPVRFIGASLGGLIGLALAARFPERVSHLVSVSAGMRPDGWGTGVRHLQRRLVREALAGNADLHTAMSHARQLGMLSYRGRQELNNRFRPLQPEQIEPDVASYLDHHGKKFADRFSPSGFLILSEAIDRSQLDATAFPRIQAKVDVIGVESDLLFPLSLQEEMHRTLLAAGVQATLRSFSSPYGHDAFLADQERLAHILEQTGVFSQPDAPIRAPLQTLRLGMVGCGVVGQALLELLHRQREDLARRAAVRFVVSRIAVRDLEKSRGPHVAGVVIEDDALAVATAPDVDVLVEVAGGIASMSPVVTTALRAGRPVVTANKALMAAHLSALTGLVQQSGASLACEAAVAGAIPILQVLSRRSDTVHRIVGIVNGTCNYLLTRMEQDGQPLEESLPEAQIKGLAEPDPSADLDGYDAAAKLSILIYRAFGAGILPTDLPRQGIRELIPEDCGLAGQMGFVIRHVAVASRTAAGLTAGVAPMLLPTAHRLAGVEEEDNAINLKTDAAGELSFFGRGAGGLPTATAVLSDLIDVALGNRAAWPEPAAVTLRPAPPRRWFVRISGLASPELPAMVAHLQPFGVTVEQTTTVGEHLGVILSAAEPSTIAAVKNTLQARMPELIIHTLAILEDESGENFDER